MHHRPPPGVRDPQNGNVKRRRALCGNVQTLAAASQAYRRDSVEGGLRFHGSGHLGFVHGMATVVSSDSRAHASGKRHKAGGLNRRRSRWCATPAVLNEHVRRLQCSSERALPSSHSFVSPMVGFFSMPRQVLSSCPATCFGYCGCAGLYYQSTRLVVQWAWHTPFRDRRDGLTAARRRDHG